MKYPPTMRYHHLTTTIPQLFIFGSQIICWIKVHHIECLLEKDRKLNRFHLTSGRSMMPYNNEFDESDEIEKNKNYR